MNLYKLKISYDGTDYHGWQSQNDVPTITNTLLKNFKNVFNHEITILGASRTDAGVHALNQIAVAKTNLEIEPEKLLIAWNNKLPEDIYIKDIAKIDDKFHPMKNVIEKTYHYNFSLINNRPFEQRYCWHYQWPVNIEKLESCLKIFEGTHDFRSFSTGYEMDSTIRTICKINLFKIKDGFYTIEVKGQSFLHHMIRRVVGACLEVSAKPKLDTNYLVAILEEKDPEQTLPNAPAKGLILIDIVYK